MELELSDVLAIIGLYIFLSSVDNKTSSLCCTKISNRGKLRNIRY